MRPPVAPVVAVYERFPEVIGAGAFSTVYKGRHRITGSNVAIKVFHEDPTLLSRFQHTIRCFERIGGIADQSRLPSGINSPNIAASEFSGILDGSAQSVFSQPMSFKPTRDLERQFKLATVTKELVVSLLDYSKGLDGKPGKDSASGEHFLVMELGDCSLEEYIDGRETRAEPFEKDQVRTILRDIAKVACLLHYHGLAHLDIKPANIMLFNSTYWKLIDFDGCYMAATVVDVLEADVAFTPLYCAPEIALSIVSQEPEFKVSRLMDVWSVGMIAAELVTLRPLLERQYLKLLVKDDDTNFLKWLANKDIPINMDAVLKFDPELHALLKEKILVKDVYKRASLPEILQHTLFKTCATKKSTWTGNEEAYNKPKEPKEAKVVRLLPINTKKIHEDSEFPLNHDQAAAFMHEIEWDGELLEVGNSDITPDLSPKRVDIRDRLLRLVCCRSN